MMTTIVTAFVPKKTNHIWTGKGKVVSIDLNTGIVILYMTSGKNAGCIGGFNLDMVRFRVKRAQGGDNE